ncbi:MAG: glutathione S-transferase family protein [Chelatococcus sp.]|jgi:putative glutathione S-transferase|uniref:glutathione S-transferase family protein n=1 Tax=Chelatococcus sp. TaxID=1953771 RepID=UPI0025BAE449|nr:glutathione S-transferase family protein [Chelatococcus sp.]MBX3539618.1 glutathione S-transferase family protein [Chelatococcus sp.]
MGMLVEGRWQDRWYDTAKTSGRFERQDSAFRNWVTADGEAGPSGGGGFKAEPGRYHLYVSLACPWAHRTLIVRKLKKLDRLIGLSIVAPIMAEHGWTFDAWPGSVPDTINHAAYLYELYAKAKPDYSGRVTVPVLWDSERRTIVSNESAEIIRMFNSAFAALTDVTYDFYPAELSTEIDATNAFVYRAINNGVYRAGFATTQEAYEEAFVALFEALDTVEERLSRQRYLAGSRLTEADWRLFTTLVRFDAVYVGHFKCNLRRIADYPNLSNYLKELYQVPGVAGTVDLAHIKRHYYGSHTTINPTRIVPVGPELDFTGPHDRDRLPAIASFVPSP